MKRWRELCDPILNKYWRVLPSLVLFLIIAFTFCLSSICSAVFSLFTLFCNAVAFFLLIVSAFFISLVFLPLPTACTFLGVGWEWCVAMSLRVVVNGCKPKQLVCSLLCKHVNSSVHVLCAQILRRVLVNKEFKNGESVFIADHHRRLNQNTLQQIPSKMHRQSEHIFWTTVSNCQDRCLTPHVSPESLPNPHTSSRALRSCSFFSAASRAI